MTKLLTTTMSMFATAAVFAAATGDVVVDKANKSVTFTAISTDCGLDTQLEFLFVGPGSDRDYESMFVTLAPVSEIVEACAKAAFPIGSPINHQTYSLWPVGNEITIEPSFSSFVKDYGKDKLPPIVYTGGSRDSNGVSFAATNTPFAIFALYDCPQSLIQFDTSFDQSATYGRFTPAVKIPQGEKRRITLKWKGSIDHKNLAVKIEKGNLPEIIKMLKNESEKSKLQVLLDFSEDLTIKEAVDAAKLISILDSPRVKVIGAKEKQLFYKAFLPSNEWRDRKERLAQPPEVHFKEDGSLVVAEIKEDWNTGDSLDPILSEKSHTFTDYKKASELVLKLSKRTSTVFLYIAQTSQLKELFEFRKHLPSQGINIYVFTE